MDEKERASVEPATSPFETRLTRDELLKRGAAAAVAVGVGGSLGGVARAATRTRRRSVASTPLDTLVVAVEGDIDTFDPAFTVGSKPSQTTIQNTFDQLTQYKQVTKHVNGITYAGVDTEAILPMLAQSYVRKGNDFIFTLRKGLKYHDGTPITAKEIEQGYKRIFDAKGISYFLLTMAAVTDPSHIKAPWRRATARSCSTSTSRATRSRSSGTTPITAASRSSRASSRRSSPRRPSGSCS